jgi:hypothetical protein
MHVHRKKHTVMRIDELRQRCRDRVSSKRVQDAGNKESNSKKVRSNFNNNGEFDPGSGRTLAACLTHASRGGSNITGARVSNA